MADGERSVRIEQQRDFRVAITRDPAPPPRVAATRERAPGRSGQFCTVGRGGVRRIPATVSVRGSDGAPLHGEPA
jgi:hypothetical protein